MGHHRVPTQTFVTGLISERKDKQFASLIRSQLALQIGNGIYSNSGSWSWWGLHSLRCPMWSKRKSKGSPIVLIYGKICLWKRLNLLLLHWHKGPRNFYI